MSERIIIFDGVCNLCNWAVGFIIERDKNKTFKFAAVQSEAGKELLERYGYIFSSPESVVLIKNGKLLDKSSAALEIASELDGFWPYLSISRIIPELLRDSLYNLVARNRYRWFGQRDSCMMPNEKISDRFLS